MNVFTIPATLSFVDALADGILREVSGDPVRLSRMTILLPNRRACRNLREAFLRKSHGKPLLLPNIKPIGDVDEDALMLGDGAKLLDGRMPVDPFRRQLILAQYLNATDPDRFTIAQALPMAAELGRFLDSVHTEGLSLDDLDKVFPEKYASHWGNVLGFLKKVLRIYWPRQLKAENVEDPGLYRRHLIEAYTQSLLDSPPDHPIIAAGSTGSIPVTAELLKTVASLPNGRVVLPGLDTVLDDESWSDIEEGHPQAGLARLLVSMGITRSDVKPWITHTTTQREHLISTLMRPAQTLDVWTQNPVDAKAFENLTLIEATTLDDEAGAIAAIMRTHAQDKDAKEPCVLVTPDRVLASRVKHYLARWHILVDDSAGQPLQHTAPGAWLLLLASVLDTQISPVNLLAALKHPLAAGGPSWPADAPPFRNFVRMLDMHILRGPRPAPGFDGLRHRLDMCDAGTHTKKDIATGLRALERLFAPTLTKTETIDRLRALITLAEDLASTPEEKGAQRLWAGDAGEGAASIVAAILQQADILPKMDWADCGAVLQAAMEQISIRPRFGTHPRLAILGPIEARLYQAGTMILGSLNEGTWPRLAEVDGWMSRPMRRDFGLPAPERAITLSSHDFCQGLGAHIVYLTRSKNRDGAPTVPSRWLQRLDAVCDASHAPDIRAHGEHWLSMLHQLDAPKDILKPLERPQPKPPITDRPMRLSVTEISKLRSDPYGIYARHVLGLEALDDIDAEPDARDRGTLIHEALENYTRAFPKDLPANVLDEFINIGKKVFDAAQAHPDVIGHWWPRFQRMARAFTRFEQDWREHTLKAWPEAKATMPFDTKAGTFTLSGRADRIEERSSGWAVIDYKSGGAPAAAEVIAGDEPQLTLLGAMLLNGAFNETLGLTKTPEHLESLSYWIAGGNSDNFEPDHIDPKKSDLETLCADAHAGLASMLKAYLEDGIPYICWPDTDRKLRDDYEYAHLARFAEWMKDAGTEEAA